MRPFVPSHRGLRLALGIAAGLIASLLVAAILLLSFGWTLLRAPIERRLTARFGRVVQIGSIRRTDHGFLDATLAIEGVRVAQPDWVGGGDFVTVRRATVTLPVLPILHGAIRPRTILIEGMAVHLVRQDAVHANWKGLPAGGGKGGGEGPDFVLIRDGTFRFDDHKRDHILAGGFAADDRGFHLSGSGMLIGRPASLAIEGAGLAGGGPWPFRLAYRSPIANADMAARADHPLDIGHFEGRVTAWGDDLRHLDLLTEAGLPGTAPARIEAEIRHDRPDWAIRRFTVALGRSRASGTIELRKRGDRTLVDGSVVATALDFDDLANAEGRAKEAAKRAAAPGRRLPDTRIALDHLMKTDGHLDVDVRHLLFARPTIFRAMKGRLALDQGVLTLAPFAMTLDAGTLAGTIRVAQTDAATRLHLDLRLSGSRIEAVASDATAFSGALSGRFLLDGTGETLRAAIGTADGRLAIVGRDGTLGRKTALLLGQDIGRGLKAKDVETARLRCGIGSFVVRAGKARPDPLLIDTDLTRAEATGLLDLTDERIDLALTGAPKQPSALRLSGPIRVTGALFAPTVGAPEATSTKGIFRAIGRALSGKPQPLAADADCNGLAARALR